MGRTVFRAQVESFRRGRLHPKCGLEGANPRGELRVRAAAGGREWFVEAPVADRADPAVIGELLGALELLTREDTLVGAARRPAEFGLDHPALRVRAWRAGGGATPVEVRFGHPTAAAFRSSVGPAASAIP